jgi:hypothetical protein
VAAVVVDTADHISKDGNTFEVDHRDVTQIQKHRCFFDRGHRRDQDLFRSHHVEFALETKTATFP